MAAAMTSPFRKRRYPVSLPSGRMARPAPLLISAHCSSGSWLPPTIGGGSAGTTPSGRAMPASSQRSRSARGNSHLPVTLVHGIAPLRHQLVELALLDPQIVGRLGRREQLQACA